MTPSLLVPPLPHVCLRCFVRALESSGDRCRFLTSVTTLPPRPLEVRCMTAVCCVGGREVPRGPDGRALRRSPHSVEYTSASLSMGIHDPFSDAAAAATGDDGYQ